MISSLEPTLFDKLFSDSQVMAARATLSIEQLKDSVARDLEFLLNTRSVLSCEGRCFNVGVKESVISYGLTDFAGLCLSNVNDRAKICRSLETVIGQHEPRLRNIKVNIEFRKTSINALYFSIDAMLVLPEDREPVLFGALFRPASLQYSVQRQFLQRA